MVGTTPFTEQHQQLRASIGRWVDDELVPNVAAWEARGRVPDAVFRRAGELGYLGLSVPVDQGGQGGDAWADVVLLEELARASASIGMALAVQCDVAALRLYGTPEQQRRWLHPALEGRVVLALAVTEPAGGSHASGIEATATPDGDGWRIDGTKSWVTNGARADHVLVVARAPQGPTLVVVDSDLPGVTLAEEVDTLGMRASDTACLVLEGVRVAGDAVVGDPGGADRVLAADVRRERLATAVLAVAAADVELQRALAHATQREAFGRPIARFQAVRHRLAEMATAVAATRQQVHVAIARAAAGDDDPLVAVEVAMAKLAASRTAWQVVDDAMQVHGGHGYSEDLPVERAWRDARATRLVLGADEVLRDVVAAAAERDPGLVVAPPRALFGRDHRGTRAAAREFVGTHLAPHVEDWEAARDFPRQVFRLVGADGWFGAKFGPAHGGTGPDLLAEVCWIEELARAGSGGLAADLGAHSQLAALYLDRQGTEAQKQRWLVPSVVGEAVGALAITEPGAGSDVNGITTRARRDGGDWVLDGTKVFITNGAWCDHVVVAARTAADAGHGGMTLFVVERDMAGFTSRRQSMLGWRTSHTGELHLDAVRVPDANLLGEQGRGFYAIMDNFAWERLMMALGGVVAAEESLALALARARERRIAGRPLLDRQAWRHRLADLATRIAGARALTDHALGLHVATERARRAQADPDIEHVAVLRATAMAKLVTQRLAVDAADECLQVHGAIGYRMDRAPQRHLRDARLGPIGGGTDDIMREIIAGTYGL